jgi:hypothetical protein
MCEYLSSLTLCEESGVNGHDDDALVRFIADKEIGGFYFRKCRYVVLIWTLTVVWLILISLSR